MHLRVAAFKLSYFATVPGINRMILQRLCIRRLSFTCRETKLGSYITESPKNALRKTMINAAGMKTEDTHNLGEGGGKPAGFFLSVLPEVRRRRVKRLLPMQTCEDPTSVWKQRKSDT